MTAATEIVNEEIGSLGKATAICDYRDRKGFMAAPRLGHILDAIELMLLPAKTAAAVEMLRRVIEIDAGISRSPQATTRKFTPFSAAGGAH